VFVADAVLYKRHPRRTLQFQAQRAARIAAEAAVEIESANYELEQPIVGWDEMAQVEADWTRSRLGTATQPRRTRACLRCKKPLEWAFLVRPYSQGWLSICHACHLQEDFLQVLRSSPEIIHANCRGPICPFCYACLGCNGYCNCFTYVRTVNDLHVLAHGCGDVL
jgi:hypothetical protein